MDIKIYVVSSGDYGSRIINNIANRGFASSIVGLHEIDDDFADFIDDVDEYIPKGFSRM